MSEKDYPPLPEPHSYAPRMYGGDPLYTADQMHAYLDADRAQRAQPEAGEWVSDWQLEKLFDAVHEHVEFGRGFRECARSILYVAPQPPAAQPVAHRLISSGPNAGRYVFDTPPPSAPPLEQGQAAHTQELHNIVNAKRFDRKVFADDSEFADWAQSRARFALATPAQATQPDDDLTAAYMAGFERGKDAAKAAHMEPPPKFVFMDGIDWQHHVGHDRRPLSVYASAEDVKVHGPECGVVRLQMIELDWPIEQRWAKAALNAIDAAMAQTAEPKA